ncbi:hypothetical protein CPB84DRAFT_1385294 [Gymnopilus junonius]|uniref:Uncharacterized protein n=1 Tax=Gymnopilus junonius TaxID=109634 RepID=A0A9P5NKM2_GYMJU|nr:hypothetical protein CPB84DRAFT_1385294 [Gymnopilus junonius]
MSANISQKGARAIASKGKQPKRFLEKNDALSLASSIAELQEKKSLIRSGKRQKSQTINDSVNDAKKTSHSKVKLLERNKSYSSSENCPSQEGKG